MRRRSFAVWALAIALSVVPCAAAREWSDISGKFKIEAEFVSLTDNVVLLKKPNGSQVAIPLEKLSLADQEVAKAAAEKMPVDPFAPVPAPGAAGAETAAGPAAAPGLVKITSKNGDKPGVVREFGEQSWGVNSLAFSPNGGVLASGKSRALEMLDVVEESRLQVVDKLESLQDVSACQFTPDGKRLVTGGSSGQMIVWNVSPTAALTQHAQFAGHTEGIQCLAISPDGKFVLSGDQGKRVRYWSIEEGREQAAFDGFDRELHACFIAKDGRTAYATDGSTLLTFNLRALKVEGKTKLDSSGQFSAFAPDGNLVATGDSYDVRIWNLRSKKEVAHFEGKEIQWSGAFTPDSTRLVTGASGKINVWDLKRQSRIAALNTAGTYYVQCLATSPDNLHVAAIPGSAGQVLEVFRIPTK